MELGQVTRLLSDQNSKMAVAAILDFIIAT